jgi:hypothetical protein
MPVVMDFILLIKPVAGALEILSLEWKAGTWVKKGDFNHGGCGRVRRR